MIRLRDYYSTADYVPEEIQSLDYSLSLIHI